MVEAVAVAFSMAWPYEAVQDAQDEEQARGVLAAFRGELSGLAARAQHPDQAGIAAKS
jgi:hypothetical protein